MNKLDITSHVTDDNKPEGHPSNPLTQSGDVCMEEGATGTMTESRGRLDDTDTDDEF